jgi:hypothetical protein
MRNVTTGGFFYNGIHRLLCLARSDEYETGITPQNLQPGLQIRTAVVDGPVFYPGDPAEERSSHFSDQFLPTVVLVLELLRIHQRGAIQPSWVTGGMNKLMEERGVVVFDAIEVTDHRHANAVLKFVIAGTISPC